MHFLRKEQREIWASKDLLFNWYHVLIRRNCFQINKLFPPSSYSLLCSICVVVSFSFSRLVLLLLLFLPFGCVAETIEPVRIIF